MSFANGDKFLRQGSDIMNGLYLFVDWFNDVKGDVVVNRSNFGLQLGTIEDFSSVQYTHDTYLSLIHEYHSDILFAPYSVNLTKDTINKAYTNSFHWLFNRDQSDYDGIRSRCSTSSSTPAPSIAPSTTVVGVNR